MRKTIIGCVSGAALVLALAACSTSSSSPAAAISHPAGAATHIVPIQLHGGLRVAPVASTNAQWYTQVSGALGQVQDDLTSIRADINSPVLTVDGAQLAQDAQAALNTEIDPAPVDNADFVTAMNDYVAAGNDYSGYNDSGAQNIGQANQEVAAAQAAIKSFNAAQQIQRSRPGCVGSSHRAAKPPRLRPGPGLPAAAAACTPGRAPVASSRWSSTRRPRPTGTPASSRRPAR